MLLVPKNDTNLRIRYACSLLCFELPTQNTESGPESLRSASRRSPTSLIASSQLICSHLPFASFIGVLSRCEFSCMPCSRAAAPLAQCAPRLSGESNTGSCRTHTPFSTIASIAHPTEQCVQTVRLLSFFVSASAAASALPMKLYGSWLANAPAPATRPERFKNARRSIVGSVAPERRRSRGRAALSPSRILVSSMVLPPPMNLPKIYCAFVTFFLTVLKLSPSCNTSARARWRHSRRRLRIPQQPPSRIPRSANAPQWRPRRLRRRRVSAGNHDA